MNRPQPHMRPPARLSALRRHSLAARRTSERGIALLMAIALIAAITAATLISLRAVAAESALQAHERRSREAFFAAQAGMAEARAWVRTQLGGNSHFSEFLNPSPGKPFQMYVNGPGWPTPEPGLPSDANVPWFEVIPRTAYTYSTTALGTGVDPGVGGANREMNGPDGVRIADFPMADNVTYRAFLVDDNDGTARMGTATDIDANGRVWLVSVGEVAGPPGTQPHRSIIRALITPVGSPGDNPEGGDKGGSANQG